MDEVPSNRFKKKSELWPSLYNDFIERCRRNGTVPNFNLGHAPWEDLDTNCVSDKHYNPDHMNNEDNTEGILLGIKNPFNHLPVPEQPAMYPSIISDTNTNNHNMSTLNTLTPIQHEIVGEISRIFTEFGAQSDLLAIVGSWGDTLPESEILQLFRQFKVSVPETVIDDIVKDAHENMQG